MNPQKHVEGLCFRSPGAGTGWKLTGEQGQRCWHSGLLWGFVLVVSCAKWFPQALRLFVLFSWAFFCVKRARFPAVYTGNAWCFLEEEKGFDENFPLMWMLIGNFCLPLSCCFWLIFWGFCCFFNFGFFLFLSDLPSVLHTIFFSFSNRR